MSWWFIFAAIFAPDDFVFAAPIAASGRFVFAAFVAPDGFGLGALDDLVLDERL